VHFECRFFVLLLNLKLHNNCFDKDVTGEKKKRFHSASTQESHCNYPIQRVLKRKMGALNAPTKPGEKQVPEQARGNPVYEQTRQDMPLWCCGRNCGRNSR
jgi:hypothetical protein